MTHHTDEMRQIFANIEREANSYRTPWDNCPRVVVKRRKSKWWFAKYYRKLWW